MLRRLSHSLADHTLGQLRGIFQPIFSDITISQHQQPWLIYVQKFRPVNNKVNLSTGLRLFTREYINEAIGHCQGAVVPVERMRMAADVAPYFDRKADSKLKAATAMEASNFFNLNKYVDIESFAILREEYGHLSSQYYCTVVLLVLKTATLD